MTLVALSLAALFGLILVGISTTYAGGPVTRARLERFARRQMLTVTVGNGNQIIRYLATTRRWRVAGFCGGLLVSLATPPDGRLINFDFVTIFVGWFAGALAAEVRVAHLAYGRRRAASLRPRRPGAYLSWSSWALVPAAAGVATLVAVSTLVADAAGSARPDWTAGFWYVVSLAVAAAVRVVQLAVLRRPQPLAEPDVLAADDAIRSRSLHVLAGGGAALVLLCVLTQLGSINLIADHVAHTIGGIRTVGVFVVAVLGWLVATAVWPARRAAPMRPSPAWREPDGPW